MLNMYPWTIPTKGKRKDPYPEHKVKCPKLNFFLLLSSNLSSSFYQLLDGCEGRLYIDFGSRYSLTDSA